MTDAVAYFRFLLVLGLDRGSAVAGIHLQTLNDVVTEGDGRVHVGLEAVKALLRVLHFPFQFHNCPLTLGQDLVDDMLQSQNLGVAYGSSLRQCRLEAQHLSVPYGDGLFHGLLQAENLGVADVDGFLKGTLQADYLAVTDFELALEDSLRARCVGV